MLLNISETYSLACNLRFLLTSNNAMFSSCRLISIIFVLNTFQEPQHIQSYNIEFIIDTSHLLVGINSAANFFLYLILRKNFRAATWRILSCKPQVIRSPRTQFSTYNHTTSGQHTLRISQGCTIHS